MELLGRGVRMRRAGRDLLAIHPRRGDGPCPPYGTHRYFFKLYALDTPLALKTGATKVQLEEAIRGT